MVSQKLIYVPNPTWGNHHKVFSFGGLEVGTYRYYDPKTRGLDYEGEGFGLEESYMNKEFRLIVSIKM